jgi:hypothetical protein
LTPKGLENQDAGQLAKKLNSMNLEPGEVQHGKIMMRRAHQLTEPSSVGSFNPSMVLPQRFSCGISGTL